MANNHIHRFVLRNEARKKDDIWVGTCLEFDIVVTARDVETLKCEMSNAVELYLEGIAHAWSRGEEAFPVSVPWYTIKRIWFDLRFTIRKRINVIKESVQLWRKDEELVVC